MKNICKDCLGDKKVQLSWWQGQYMSTMLICKTCKGTGKVPDGEGYDEETARGVGSIRDLDDYLARGGKWD